MCGPLQALVYSLGIYFMAGLSLNKHGAHFLEFLGLLFMVCYFGSSLVLLLSAISPILEAANALAGRNTKNTWTCRWVVKGY